MTQSVAASRAGDLVCAICGAGPFDKPQALGAHKRYQHGPGYSTKPRDPALDRQGRGRKVKCDQCEAMVLPDYLHHHVAKKHPETTPPSKLREFPVKVSRIKKALDTPETNGHDVSEEVGAICVIATAFGKLDDGGRRRAFAYLNDLFGPIQEVS